jgi:lipoprotein-releasing system permease protein
VPFAWFWAWARIRKRKLQTGLTVAGVAVGVAVLIVALSLTNGFIDELLNSTLKATPHVSLETNLNGGQMDASSDLEAAIASHARVVAVEPFLAAEALIARRANADLGVTARQGYVQMLGVRPGSYGRIVALDALQRVNLPSDDTAGLLLGGSLALRLGVLPGDPVMVQDASGHRKSFEVAGRYRVGNELIDGLVAFTSLASLRNYLGADAAISGYHVRLDDPGVAADVARELEQTTGLRAVDWGSLFGGLVQQLRLQKVVISLVTFLIVIVAAMGIANILVLTVSEKTVDVAVVRAFGGRNRGVLATFTLEGALLGGMGTALGVAVGLLASAYLRSQPVPLPGDLYFITQLPVRTSMWDVAWVSALALLTSTLAGFIPARRAVRRDPSAVLRA